MTKQNKKPAPAPEALSFMDLIRKVGNDTVASMRQDLADGKLPASKKKPQSKTKPTSKD
jgi:hypothetical protein